jgi:sorbitol-specific phosphotransferase system component IIC
MLYKMMDLLNSCILTNPVAYTFCRTKNIIRRKKNSTGRSVNQDMDDAQGTYNYEDEGRIFGMGVDVAVT